MPQVTSIDGSGFQAYGGTRIAFPDIEFFDLAATETGSETLWLASGLGSQIDLSGLRSIRGGTESQSRLTVESTFGGNVDLRSVEQVVDPMQGNTSGRRFAFLATGDGSRIRLDALANVIDRQGDVRSTLGDVRWRRDHGSTPYHLGPYGHQRRLDR